MIKVVHVDVDHIPNETCAPTKEYPEGRYPTVRIEIDVGSVLANNHEVIEGKTCACGEGHVTYGTWRLPPEEMLFQDKKALIEYLNKNDAYASTHGIEKRLDLVPRCVYW